MRLILLGFLVILLGFALVIAGSVTSPTVGFGGVVLIGPFPIFFGEGPSSYAGDFVILGIVLTVIAVGFYLLNIILLKSFRR